MKKKFEKRGHEVGGYFMFVSPPTKNCCIKRVGVVKVVCQMAELHMTNNLEAVL